MPPLRNLAEYFKQAHMIKGEFAYRGTTALKKGRGMCFDMDFLTTETGETATDDFGGRGFKTVEVPSSSNNGAFAGVLTQDYPARTSGVQLISLWLPGGCALVSQRVESTINTKLVTCVVGEDDSGDTTLINGVFGHGGFSGRGSALPLTTMASATLGDMAFQNVLGTATSVYSSTTDLTTFTMTAAGTALGFTSVAIDASAYECTVWGGATASDSTAERVPSGVFPVVQAVTADTFTVTGDVGDGACTINLAKIELLRLVYLQDGRESGLSAIYIPETASVVSPIIDHGFIIVLGGLTLAADCEPVVNDGTIDGQLLGFYMLATIVTKEMLINITSGHTLSGTGVIGTTLATIEFLTAGEWCTMEWHEYGPGTSAAWALTGLSATSVAPA